MNISTHEWWGNRSSDFECATSISAIEELEKGTHPHKNQTLELINELPLLPVKDTIVEVVEAYVKNHVMPKNPQGDALHLALASFYNCHFLLTWNCRHLANANKFEHIRYMNTVLGLYSPILTTPFELL